MYRVTLYIEDLSARRGAYEKYQFEAEAPYVLPLVFRAVDAAVAAHPGEVPAIATAVKVIADAIAGATEPAVPFGEGGE